MHLRQTDSKQSSATQLEIRRIMANFKMKVTHSFGEVFEVEVISQRGKPIDFRFVSQRRSVVFLQFIFGVSRRLNSVDYRSQTDCFPPYDAAPGNENRHK